MHELREITCVCLTRVFLSGFLVFSTFKFGISFLDSHIVTWSCGIQPFCVRRRSSTMYISGQILSCSDMWSGTAIPDLWFIYGASGPNTGRWIQELTYMDPWTSWIYQASAKLQCSVLLALLFYRTYWHRQHFCSGSSSICGMREIHPSRDIV